jgi:multidrug efflux pump subunit AcrA (membrane-fusion protein)
MAMKLSSTGMGLLACAMLAGAALLGGCKDESQAAGKGGRGGEAVKEAPIYVELLEVKRVPIQRSVEVVGTLYGVLETTISAKVPGRLTEVRVDIGQRVKPGEMLAQIDPRDYALSVEQRQLAVSQSLSKLGLKAMPGGEFDVNTVPSVVRAAVQVENTKSRYLRAKQLYDQKPPLLSAQDYGDIETAWKVAESNLDVEKMAAGAILADARFNEKAVQIAKEQLADTKVIAPSDMTWGASRERAAKPAAQGQTFIVAARLVNAGENVKDGTPMFKLIADDPILLRASVPEKHASEVKIGQVVKLSVQSSPEEFVGKVVRVNPQVDSANRAFVIEAEFDNKGEKLNPGSFGTAQVQTRVDGSAALVPISAVTTFAGVHRVYSVRDGKVLELRVKLGEKQGDLVEVVQGLAEGLPVVIKSEKRLHSGAVVTLVKPAGESVPATQAKESGK